MSELEEELEIDEESEELDDDEIEDSHSDIPEDRWIPKWRRSNCPKSDSGHNAIQDKIAAKFGKTQYLCEYCGKRDWTGSELEFIADKLLRENSNAELCRVCRDINPETLPYGRETGHTEWQLQKDVNGDAILDEQGEAIYVGFPELTCDKGHRWYKGEGPRRNINGKNPILFESHIYNRKRREIYASDGVVDPAYTMDRWGKRPVQALYNRCVDDQTQALTPTGWKHYDELSKGDSIWTYNIESDTCDWQDLLDDPFVNESFVGEMQVLESRNISARVTEGHRWAVVHEYDKSLRYEVTTKLNPLKRSPIRDSQTGRMIKQPLFDHLTDRHYIPLARKELMPDISGNTDLFELLGWILSDGSYPKGTNNCRLSQAMHNKKLSHLISCLKANNINPEPSTIDQNNVGTWYIPVSISKPLRSLTNNIKSVTTLDLSTFTHAEYYSVYKGYLYGDGYVRPSISHGLGEIQSTRPEESEALQGLLTRIGITSSSTHNHQPTAFCQDMYPVTAKDWQWGYIRPAIKSNEYYEGTVWCPTVKNGFWMAKRNNKIYVTGNSHPDGRKTNTSEQRAKGSGWYK